jgi:transcriptional regulator with XRE-family HTH domain
MATTGKTLKLERVRAEVTIVDLAARMGLSRQSLWVLERSATVDPSRVSQYRAALDGLRDASQTSEGAA